MADPRELTEAEKWSRPMWIADDDRRTVKFRIECQHGYPDAPHSCVANATVKLGRWKLCRTHARIALEGRGG